MFQLETEVHNWCRSICQRARYEAGIEELKDHLYCEIERLLETGFSEEEAFLAATKQMGNTEDLVAEHSKNRSFFSVLCHKVQEKRNNPEKRIFSMNPKKAAFWNIVISLVFATAIIFSSYMLTDTSFSQTITYVLIALWWVPFSILSAAGSKHSAKSEYLCMKRKVAGLFH